MQLTGRIATDCVLDSDELEIRFTPSGAKVAVWRDPTHPISTHFECWNEIIIDALFDLTSVPGKFPMKVKGRKETRGVRDRQYTVIIVQEWRLIHDDDKDSPVDMATESEVENSNGRDRASTN